MDNMPILIPDWCLMLMQILACTGLIALVWSGAVFLIIALFKYFKEHK